MATCFSSDSLLRPHPCPKDHFEVFRHELDVGLDDQLVVGHLVQPGWRLADVEPRDGLVTPRDALTELKHLHIAEGWRLVSCVEGGQFKAVCNAKIDT